MHSSLRKRYQHPHTYTHRPPKSFDSLQIPEPITLASINDTKTHQRLSDRCEKIVQRSRYDMILIYIAVAEAKMNEWKDKFDTDLDEMKEYLVRGASHKRLHRVMVDILYRPSFFRHSSDGQELDLVYRWSSFIEKSKVHFSPTLYHDSHQHHLSSKQMEFLHRGPSYVSTCQLHIVSGSSLNMDHLLTKQMSSLRRVLTRVFTKYPVDLSRRMNFEKEIQNLFHASFDQSIPSTFEERPQNEFQQKSDDFVQHSTSYEFIGMFDGINTEQQQLDELVNSINSQFETLHQKRLINNDYRTKFTISKKSTMKLPYLYFLPEINEDANMTV
ncbi:unnamed protein product [Rotaria socialis]|uniref:Uncharacterized protein n=2 Tax=Rotaria socialis TaxID=392032 RepID=A0A820UJE6_9BILA|nr:unnamed protein product [Rotaria socialis]